MTDKEIIEALERCSLHSECCYCNSVEECGNKRVLTASVLELINHLKTKCNKYLNKVQAQKGELARLYKQNAEYKAEIERLKKSLDNMTDALVKTDEACRSAENDAIKDFAERVKRNHITKDDKGEIHLLIEYDEFDNLVKEMARHISKIEHNSLCETETYEVEDE